VRLKNGREYIYIRNFIPFSETKMLIGSQGSLFKTRVTDPVGLGQWHMRIILCYVTNSHDLH
jgi:hypothetical protein